jgi:tetratricopeptide (TPR) repeat protein
MVAIWLSGGAAVAQTSAPSTESRFSRQPELEITFQQGLLHYSRGQLPQAEQEFRSVVQADPADAEAYYHLGLAQLDQGKASAAVESFNQSLNLDPTVAEVRAARATANIRIAHYDQAEEDLRVLQDYPAFQTLVHYLRGQLHYAKGDLDQAAAEFATAKRLGGTESVPAEFYEGLTYLRMRELVRARSTFREAALGADRDPTVASASRQLDAVLAAQQRRNRPWEVQLTLGTEWDSNVIQIGSNIPNPAGVSDESDFRLLVQPRGSYSFYRNGTIDAGLEASGYFTWHQDLSDFDVESYQAGPFINYKVKDNVFASLRYGFNFIRVGKEDFLTRNIITPQLTFIEPKFGYTSAYYQFQTRQFSDESTSEALDRDGTNHVLGVVQGISLPELFRDAGPANLELTYRFEHQETDGSDFDGNFHTVGATLYTPLPIWKLRADIGATLDLERYTESNSLDDDGDKRRDTEWGAVVGLTRQINANWALRVDYSYTDRNSNVAQISGGAERRPFEYDRHLVGVRLIFSY